MLISSTIVLTEAYKCCVSKMCGVVMNTVAGMKFIRRTVYVDVGVFTVQRQACAALLSHSFYYFLYFFPPIYLPYETSNMHFPSPTGAMRIQINYKSQKTVKTETTSRRAHMASNVCMCERECAGRVRSKRALTTRVYFSIV